VRPYHPLMAIDPPIPFPEICPGEPLTVSGTLFQTFERCPEQAAGRLRGVYGPESRASFVGGLAHRVFARHLNAGPIDGEEFTGVCREEIGSSMNPKLRALGLKPSELQAVVDEVGSLYERFRSLGADGFEGAEVPLESIPVDGVTLRGRVDAVFEDGDAGTRLVDWKTGGLGEPAAQLGFYALLWVLERDEIPGKVEAVSVSSGERFEEIPSRAGVTAIADRVGEMVNALRSAWDEGTDLSRVAGPWCRWCPLLDECSEGQAARTLLGG